MVLRNPNLSLHSATVKLALSEPGAVTTGLFRKVISTRTKNPVATAPGSDKARAKNREAVHEMNRGRLPVNCWDWAEANYKLLFPEKEEHLQLDV